MITTTRKQGKATGGFLRTSGSARANRRSRGRREPELRRGGSSDRCWCGEEAGHGWPGKGKGEPHPR